MTAQFALEIQGTPRPAPTTKRPRYYQEEMRREAATAFASHRSALAVMATGTGKTFTASLVIRDHLRGPGLRRVLWLNERDNLVQQMRHELEGHLGEPVVIEQAQERAPRTARVVVGSLQSMAQDVRLQSFPRDHFTLIVPDEAHHSVTTSYRKILGHFSHAKILGLTATPMRLDGLSMQLVYETQVADYDMGRGIADGYLVRVDLRPHLVRAFDISGLKKSNGDFTEEAIAAVMTPEVVRGIIDATIEHSDGRRGVLYFPRVDIAHAAAKACNLIEPGSAYAIDGEMSRDEKRAIIAAHKRGDFLRLMNCGVVTEGHDDSGIAFVGMGRPTNSLSRYIQEVGRGTRPAIVVDVFGAAAERCAAIAASSKPNVRVLDFCGNSGKHNLASMVDALAGKLDDAETRKRAKQILKEQGGGDAMEALEKARRLSEAERQEEAQRIARVNGVRWEWRSIDPFSGLGLDGPTDVAGAGGFKPGASASMIRWLRSRGVNVPPQLTHDDAVRLSKTIRAREKKGLADLGQIRILSRHGIAAQRMYKGTAKAVMDEIARNRGWTPPQERIEAIINSGRGGEL